MPSTDSGQAEKMDGLHRIHWTAAPGLGGHHPSDSLDALRRIRWTLWAGLRNQRLRVLSVASEKPVSQMIREAIDAYLQSHQSLKPGQEWFWAEAWRKAEHEAEKDLATGNYETFSNDADFLASLK